MCSDVNGIVFVTQMNDQVLLRGIAVHAAWCEAQPSLDKILECKVNQLGFLMPLSFTLDHRSDKNLP